MLPNKEGEMPDREEFFGINEDIKYLAEWINTFVSRKNRWESPKYIIGESYGGTRVMGLSLELQERQWMYLNGVILVSPADYRVYNTGGAVGSAINLPYYTAAAWYHKALDEKLQNKDLLDILPESEEFTINGLKPPMMVGKNHKELLLAQIRAIEDSRGSTNWFFFKSDYIKIMYRGKEKWALSTTYTIQKEPMFTLSIHVKIKDSKKSLKILIILI